MCGEPGPSESRPDARAIQDAFKEIPTEQLTMFEQSIGAAVAALNSIDSRMRGEGGPDVAPDFGPLATQLAKLNRLYKEQLASRSDAAMPAGEAASGEPGMAGGGVAVGAIRSRQAPSARWTRWRVLRRTSVSPIPLFVEPPSGWCEGLLEGVGDIAAAACGRRGRRWTEADENRLFP